MERLIDKYLPADYHDTFIVKAQKPAEQIIPKELIKKIFNHSPAWLSLLMKVKDEGKHISLFFIREAYHRKGIGRRLFDAFIEESSVPEMTVNSSTYAVPFYKSLGFVDRNLHSGRIIILYIAGK